MATTRRSLTDEDISAAARMVGWKAWFGSSVFIAAGVGVAIVFIVIREVISLFLFLIFGAFALVNVFPRLRAYKQQIVDRIGVDDNYI